MGSMHERKILVAGHKNPDTDPIASAVAYGALLRLQGLVSSLHARVRIHEHGDCVRWDLLTGGRLRPIDAEPAGLHSIAMEVIRCPVRSISSQRNPTAVGP